ncbi:MAG: hypothetical protein RSD99_19210, partial [Janthinobacterium sp.]
MIWIKNMVKRGTRKHGKSKWMEEKIPTRNKAVFNDAACCRAPLKNAAGKAPCRRQYECTTRHGNAVSDVFSAARLIAWASGPTCLAHRHSAPASARPMIASHR